jgi:hypothetical protein
MPSPDSRSYPTHRPNVIPSSNLSRNGPNDASHGTPDGVMRSMMARKEEKTKGRSDLAGEDKPLPSLTSLFDTPPSGSASRIHQTSSPSLSRTKTPSLVAAAQASSSDSTDIAFISRLVSQFPSVSRSRVVNLLEYHRDDKAKVSLEVRRIDRELKLKAAGQLAPTVDPSAPARNLHVRAPVVHPSPVKPKKHQSSAIYNNKGNEGKKRRGHDSESEGQMSDAESEMDWSDEEGPRKRKKKNDEVVRPEKAALKAFNDATVEELTGTIGTSIYESRDVC